MCSPFATKMKKHRIAKVSGGFAILCTVAMVVFWYVGHRPIAYHNDTLRHLIGSAVRMELSIVPQYGPDGRLLESDPPIVITDRSEIDRILRRFELPWHLRASNRFHECSGHLVVVVTMPGSQQHKIQYDHGKGLYPIYLEDSFPGFCDLPAEACNELNEIFFGLGFSSRDLGI